MSVRDGDELRSSTLSITMTVLVLVHTPAVVGQPPITSLVTPATPTCHGFDSFTGWSAKTHMLAPQRVQ